MREKAIKVIELMESGTVVNTVEACRILGFKRVNFNNWLVHLNDEELRQRYENAKAVCVDFVRTKQVIESMESGLYRTIKDACIAFNMEYSRVYNLIKKEENLKKRYNDFLASNRKRDKRVLCLDVILEYSNSLESISQICISHGLNLASFSGYLDQYGLRSVYEDAKIKHANFKEKSVSDSISFYKNELKNAEEYYINALRDGFVVKQTQKFSIVGGKQVLTHVIAEKIPIVCTPILEKYIALAEKRIFEYSEKLNNDEQENYYVNDENIEDAENNPY
jgi:hypothetical protein